MNICYFNILKGINKLGVGYISENQSVENFKLTHDIDEECVTLIKPWNNETNVEIEKLYKPDSAIVSLEDYAKFQYLEFAKFDNIESPTDVIFDLDLLKMFFINEWRDSRKELFETLDKLQISALLKQRQDIIDEIEIDKQKLRDLPTIIENMQTTATTFSDVYYIPQEILIDYEAKYNSRLYS